MLQHKTERLGSAPLGPLLLKLSIPGIVAMVVMAFHNIIDTFWVGRIGPGAIAALTIVFPYQMLMGAVGAGTGAGIMAFSSRCFGKRDMDTANRIAGQVLFLAFFFGILFLTATMVIPDQILQAFGVTADIFGFAFDYITIIGFGAAFVFFSIMSDSLFRGAGDTFTPMVFMLTSALLNMILDPFLIFGIGPFPELGVRGAALATVVAQVTAALIGFLYLWSGRSGYHLHIHTLRPDFSVIREIYRVGLPSFIIQVVHSAFMMILNHVMGQFGSAAIAAVGLLFRVGGFVIMPLFGMTQGFLPIVGFNFGAGNRDRLWKAVRIAGLSAFFFCVISLSIIALLTPFWVGLFTDDPVLMDMAVPGIRISLMAIYLVGPQIMWSTTFQGLAKGSTAMFLSLTRQIIFLIPLLIILPRFLGIGGVWLSFPLSDFAAFCVSSAWLYREYRTFS